MSAPRPYLKRLVRDQRGTGVIELAIAAPFMAFLMLGVTDIAMGYSQKLRLEQAAARTVEKATAQDSPGSGYDYLVTEAATASGQASGNVTLDSWLECDGTRQTLFSGACTSGQQIARYVSISITGLYTPLFNYGPMSRLYGGTATSMGTVTLTGDAAVRVQ